MAQTKGERTAERILEATAHCIATFGIEESSITRIATQAEVSRALVAHYYPQKARIFLQVVHFIVEKAYLEIGAMPEGTPQVRLLHVFRSNLEFFLKHSHYFKCFMLFYYMSGVDAEYRALNSKLTEVAVERIREPLTELGMRDKALPDILHNQMLGAILKFHSTQVKEGPEVFVKTFLKRIKQQLNIA